MTVSKDQKSFIDKALKIKPAQWKEMNGFIGQAKDILAQGGLTNFFKSELMAIKDDLISMFIDPLVAPLLEAFSPIMADLLEDVIPKLQDAILLLGDAIGKILGIELPGGETIGGALGKLLAFSIEFTSPMGLLGKLFDLLGELKRLLTLSWNTGAFEPGGSAYESILRFFGPGLTLDLPGESEEYEFH